MPIKKGPYISKNIVISSSILFIQGWHYRASPNWIVFRMNRSQLVWLRMSDSEITATMKIPPEEARQGGLPALPGQNLNDWKRQFMLSSLAGALIEICSKNHILDGIWII